MADLPEERTQEAPPFMYCGMDMFGPFTIKCHRTELKRYGIIFTCLASRTVHLEVANTMDTDSFIQALRRFIARRGNMRMLRTDNDTNLVGGQTEQSKAFQEMDHERISSSHIGGTWERQIFLLL